MANDPKVVSTTKDWWNQAVNDKGYREGVDYSLAIRDETDPGKLQQLKDERAAKIKEVYDGDDPYTTAAVNKVTGQATTPTNTAAKYGSDWTPQNATVQSSAAYRDLQNQVNAAVFGSQAQQPTVQQQPTQQAPVVQQPAFDVQSIINTQQQATTEVKDKFTTYLDQWLADAQTQAKNAADYAVNQGVAELERAEADAQVQFQNQRDQIDIDEARAKDNQALYAERRGDKGGIGAAQYDAIMATAAKNRLAVNQSQVKLSTDTARQIADLRAQGEFEKADKLLALSQQYLSQLVQLEQWALSYGMDVAQFQASLQQWQAEFEMAQSELTGFYNGAPTLGYQKYQNELQMAERNNLIDQGWMFLQAGIPPTESQLAAMGLTASQAQDYITAQKLAAQSKGSPSEVPADIYSAIFNSGATNAEDAWAYLVSNGYKSQADVAYQLADQYAEKYNSGEFYDAITWNLLQKGYSMPDPSIWNNTRTVDDKNGGSTTQLYVAGPGWVAFDEVEAGVRAGVLDVVPDVKKNQITIVKGARK
jgi:hypothetical protein